MLNEVDIDFRIPGLPHSVVKQAENFRVRELVEKIENHLTDNLFNEICNKTMPTTRWVRHPRKCIRTGKCRAVWFVRDRPENAVPIIWKRDASRGVLKGSTIPFWTILIFVHPSSNMIELKRSVSRWTSFRKKDFSHHMTQAGYFRYKKNWWISLNKFGKNGPLRNRSDFNDALSTLNHLHQELGERKLRPVPFWKYQQWHQSSSSSTSWWQWSDS